MATPFNPPYAVGATAIAATWQTHTSFGLNSITLLLLIAGVLLAVRKLKSQPGDHSFDDTWFIAMGPVFFAVPLAVFGMQHFAERNDVIQAVPPWMPGHLFWVYFVGIALIAAALSLITGRMARLAALLLATMFFLFVLMIHLPNVWTNPGDRFAIAVLFRDLSLGAAALSLAATLSGTLSGTLTGKNQVQSARWMAIVGRCLFAVAMIVFGVEHFAHPLFAPGVPLEKMMPTWMPGPIIWAWITGALLIVCGVSLLIKQRGRTAGVVLGLWFLALVIFIYLPMEILHPSIEISGELDYVADTLIFSGASFFVADSLSRKNRHGSI